MLTGDAEHRWWLCCWGHVFEHDPVPNAAVLTSPALDGDEPCGTSFLFLPFRSDHEAREANESNTTRLAWAPWAI